MAEREGFEPSKGYEPLLVFKTSAFNRSATSPVLQIKRFSNLIVGLCYQIRHDSEKILLTQALQYRGNQSD